MKLLMNIFQISISFFLFKKVSPFCESVPTSKANKETCLNEKAQDNEFEECCLLQGYSETYDGKESESECVEILRKDTENNEILKEAVGDIIKGKYWMYSNYDEKYTEIDQVFCSKSSFTISPCESTENPEGIGNCTEQNTNSDEDICCLLNDNEIAKCVDIKKKDKERIEEIKLLITTGNYWSHYSKNFTKKMTLTCENNYINYSKLFLILMILTFY